MLVYRIEDDQGGGLYRGHACGMNPLEFVPSKHPAPHKDSLLVHNGNLKRDPETVTESFGDWIEFEGYNFGFASTEQLRAWVFCDMWLWRMQERGFRLTAFDIPSEQVIVGHTQAMFKRKHVKCESYFDIAEFFGIYDQPEDDTPD